MANFFCLIQKAFKRNSTRDCSRPQWLGRMNSNASTCFDSQLLRDTNTWSSVIGRRFGPGFRSYLTWSSRLPPGREWPLSPSPLPEDWSSIEWPNQRPKTSVRCTEVSELSLEHRHYRWWTVIWSCLMLAWKCIRLC